MTSYLAATAEWADPSLNTQSSPTLLVALSWYYSRIMDRIYALERESYQLQEQEERKERGQLEEMHKARKCYPSLKVLFQLPLTAKVDVGVEDICPAKQEPLRCPDVITKLISYQMLGTETNVAINEVVNLAYQCLLEACTLLQTTSTVGGSTSAMAIVSDDADGGVHNSSSSGVDTSRTTIGMHCSEFQASPTNMDCFRRHTGVNYSSEDGTGVLSGDTRQRIGLHSRRSNIGKLQYAQTILRYLTGVAFSSPCKPLAKAFQYVIARQLEHSPRCFESCSSILKCLSPVDDTITLATSTVTGGRRKRRGVSEGSVEKEDKKEKNEEEEEEGVEDTNKKERNVVETYLYLVNGVPVTSTLTEALSSHNSSMVTKEKKWYVCPSQAPALPSLVRLLSGEACEELNVLQQLEYAEEPPASPVPLMPVYRRRGGGLSRNRMCRSSSSTIDKEHSGVDESTGDDLGEEPSLWDALCNSTLTISRTVSADRVDMLYRVFTEMGEIPNYYYILSLCPELLRAHHKAFQYIFFDEGPLPICERLMVAIMVASRQKCEYLFCRFAALLMRFAGETHSTDNAVETWLLQGPPPKLQALQRFIAIATHVPWQMNVEEIRATENAGWSIPGLIQVSCIVAETLSLCSFVMGLFVPNEMWTCITLPDAIVKSISSCPSVGGEHTHQSKIDFARYTGVDDIVTENRIKGSSGNAFVLWSGTFNWQEHGDTFMEQYYPGAAALINTELDAFSAVLRQLNPSDCIGLTTPEYSPLYAFGFLRLYVQNIIGFMADDYPYTSINKVLRRPAKLIAQSCTMRPETMSSSQIRLWVPVGVESVVASGDGKSPRQSTGETVEKQQQQQQQQQTQQQVDQGVKEQKQQLIESLTSHRAPFKLSIPRGSSKRRQEPQEEDVETALHLHEERLIFLLLLSTMEARKEGLLAVLLHPMWVLLNNM